MGEAGPVGSACNKSRRGPSCLSGGGNSKAESGNLKAKIRGSAVPITYLAENLYMLKLLFFALAAATVALAAEDPLPRRPTLGAQVLPVTDAERADSRAQFEGGVRLGNIFPGTSAEGAGLTSGDILLSIDGQSLHAPTEIGPLLKQLGSNKTVPVELVRNERREIIPMLLRPAPRESADDFDVVYDAVTIDGFKRRVVLTKPHTPGKHPLFVLIGGLGCYSVDPLQGGMLPYKEILYAMTREGFCTLRVEFTGMGDSEGPPCAEQGFHDEVHGFVEGIKAMNRYDFIDMSKVILFGHSMGGLVGPEVATQIPVQGIVALATGAIDWTEYELINQRRQLVLEGVDYDSIETACKVKTQALYQLAWEGKPSKDIIKEHPEWEGYLTYPVSDKFMRDLVVMSPATALKEMDAKILFIYGTSDFVTAANEHLYGMDIVNRYHPGHATYQEIDDFDHFLLRTPDQKSSFENLTGGMPNKEFNADVIPVIAKWAKETVGP